MSVTRIVPVGDAAMRVEYEDRIDPVVNARAVALAETVRAARWPGVYDVVPAYRSVTIFFNPLRTDATALVAALERDAGRPGAGARAPVFLLTVPVTYGGEHGPDLADVAAWAGISSQEVVRHHTNRAYRVYMMGFLPGFAYLGPVHPTIAAPRRATPRLRVVAGSVGIAGAQTGIYPSDSPGGWQIIGRTSTPLVDFSRADPFMLRTGDTVQFVAVDSLPEAAEPLSVQTSAPSSAPAVQVVKPGWLSTIQDGGRTGMQASGVPVAGPMDPVSYRVANAMVGNRHGEAAIEVTLNGPELEFEDERLVAVAGARFDLMVNDRTQASAAGFVMPAGARLRFGARRAGARAYLAVSGGFDVPPILGSRATHMVSGMGGFHGRALRAGDRIPLGPRPHGRTPATSWSPASAGPNMAAAIHEDARAPAPIRVLPGPDAERFSPDALIALQSAPYAIDAESDRMGFRLSGPSLVPTEHSGIISDATPLGALQVPSSGQPVLLMADRQTSGGYPILATVISADIPAAGQLAPGDAIRFSVCTPREALAALIAQEQRLLAIEAPE